MVETTGNITHVHYASRDESKAESVKRELLRDGYRAIVRERNGFYQVWANTLLTVTGENVGSVLGRSDAIRNGTSKCK